MHIVTLSALRGIEEVPLQDYAVAVIDVLRASTTILCLMEHGAREVRLLGSLEEALPLRAQGYALVGERGDTPLPGFEADNSPHYVAGRSWAGRRVAITTSNGTRALLAVRRAASVCVAGFRNLSAVADYALSLERSLALVPIGSGGSPRLEDELCAEALRRRLSGEDTDFADMRRRILAERAEEMRRKPGYAQDAEHALTMDATRIVPVLRPGLVLGPVLVPDRPGSMPARRAGSQHQAEGEAGGIHDEAQR